MPTQRNNLHFTPTDLPMGLFLIAAGLAIIPALDHGLAWRGFTVLAAGVSLYAIVSRVGSGGRRMTAILRIATIFTALVAIYFFSQYGHYIEAGKVGVITRLARGLARFTPEIHLWQPLGNSMATLLEGLVFVCLGAWAVEQRGAWRWLAGVAALLAVGGVLISESRGAWLAVLAGGLAVLAARSRSGQILAGVGLGLALILVGLVVFGGGLSVLESVPLLGPALTTIFFRPDRLDVYRGSLYLLQDQPFTGLGLGQQFPWIYSRYVLLIQVPYLDYSHNFYLETWLQTGLMGITTLVWLISAVGLMAIRLGKDVLSQSAWAGIIAVLVHGLTDARQYNDGWTWLPFFLLLGLVAARWIELAPAGKTRWYAWLPPGAALIFLLVVLVGIRSPLAAWEANRGSLAQARVEIPAMQNQTRADPAKLSEAEWWLQRSVEHLPEQRIAHLRLGLMLTDREDFGEAVSQLEAALSADANNPVTRKALGLAYTWAGKIDQAARMLTDTPGMVEELNQWASWREVNGQRDLAIYAARVSLLLQPDQPALRDAIQRLQE